MAGDVDVGRDIGRPQQQITARHHVQRPRRQLCHVPQDDGAGEQRHIFHAVLVGGLGALLP